MYALGFQTSCESGLVTVRPTSVGACAGMRATMRVAVTEMIVACRVSTDTLTPALKFDPLMVTSVLPLAGPLTGDSEDTTGAGARYVKAWGNWTPLPSVFSTVSETMPSACAGVRTTRLVEVRLVTVPDSAPRRTMAPFLKLVPVTVTLVPPAIGPNDGEKLVTVGELAVDVATYVKPAPREAVPPSVLVTVTPTAPATAAGVLTVSVVGVNATTVPATPPNFTTTPDLKPVPVMVTACCRSSDRCRAKWSRSSGP